MSPKELQNKHASKSENSSNISPSNIESRKNSPCLENSQSTVIEKFASKPQNCWCWNPIDGKKETPKFVESGFFTSSKIENDIEIYNDNDEIDNKNMGLFKEVIILEVEEQPDSGYHLTSINTTQYENLVKIEVAIIKDNDCKSNNCLSKNFLHNIASSNDNVASNILEGSKNEELINLNDIKDLKIDIKESNKDEERIKLDKVNEDNKEIKPNFLEENVLIEDSSHNCKDKMTCTNKPNFKNNYSYWNGDSFKLLKIDSNHKNVQKLEKKDEVVVNKDEKHKEVVNREIKDEELENEEVINQKEIQMENKEKFSNKKETTNEVHTLNNANQSNVKEELTRQGNCPFLKASDRIDESNMEIEKLIL